MIETPTYLLFIAAVMVLVLAPGPDMLYMLTGTIAQGRRAGVLAAVGINVALVYFASIATAGLRRNRKLALWLNRAMGTVFIALGIRLAREEL